MYRNTIKRLLDIIFSLVLIVLLSPLFLVIAILVRRSSEGPIIFQQLRSGKRGKIFTLYKFRTMSKDNDVYDASGEDILTPIGAKLRALSLDELPQLFNIAKGEMSFIGPRPWVPVYFESMTPHQQTRYNVRPGITGLAQVSGRNSLTIFEKIEQDLAYVSCISFLLDIQIFWRTIATVFKKSSHQLGKLGIHEEIGLLRSHRNAQD